jgi:hypothetical protein
MPLPINGVSGTGGDRSPTTADLVAEARLRQADRLRTAQAENAKPTEVVESAEKPDAPTIPHKDQPQPYRVQLDPDTHRLFTEVIDTASGDVIMRIPQTYVLPDVDPGDADDPLHNPFKGAAGEDDAAEDDGPAKEIKA